MAAPHHDENTPSKVKASFCFSSMRRNSCIVRDNEKRLRARRLRTDFFDGIVMLRAWHLVCAAKNRCKRRWHPHGAVTAETDLPRVARQLCRCASL